MQANYEPQTLEPAIQAQWRASDVYRVTEDSARPKYYACSMLPYPSGKLHMGHVRNYTINDMLARQLRMKGYNVLMPMGWDAFGLPAENAAMKNGVPPARWTYDNIAYMKQQMQAMGLAIDWSREVATCDASYYKWNQWLFLKMLEKGIAYRKTQVVNWDPVDQTVLANEQVIDGRGWRTGAPVEKREIPGYYLRITDYAQELLDHVQPDGEHATLDGWPARVRLMQENWIGKSQGVSFAFTHDIHDSNGGLIQNGRMQVFTTRADTIMGVTFCAVAPEHPLALHAAANQPGLADFIERCKQGGTTEAELAAKDKEGMDTGLQVQHPLTGEPVAVWVGNYVLMSYGGGAVMGVPAHDERDFAFALKYGLPIQQVVASRQADEVFDATRWQPWYASKDGVCVNSGVLDGMAFAQAVDHVASTLAERGLGDKQTTWRLRDWGISRQRYWGTPIPMIHCNDCGAVPVPEADLPVQLPQDLVPDGSGNPLNQCESFLRVACPTCGKPARRETDTMDTFVDSAWYFMRYCDPQRDDAMVAEGARYWMPMDQYIGGIEHAILHLLYARFWTKVMRDVGLVAVDEPFTKLLTQGMVLNHIYSRKDAKGGVEYFWPHEVQDVTDESGKVTGAVLKDAKGPLPAGTPITYEGVGTMSKSKNNGVDPQDLIERYGADTARLYTMFTAPPEATLEWNDSAVEGSARFLRRVWAYGHTHQQAIRQGLTANQTPLPAAAQTLRRELHTVLRQATYDYERMQYNTVVSAVMKMLNALEGAAACHPGAQAEGFGLLLRVLYPACPHITEALWQTLGYATPHGPLLDAPWPQVDEAALQQDEIELVLQINGKLRGSLTVAAQADTQTIEAAALASDVLARYAAGATPRKVVVVPGRLVNVVV
ncbi:MAG: leucine--tRNA ligase [Betaproteobacteria bacterium]|nr:leucine--tRNA ligase [Candidatus Fonsibacter lacus]